MANSTHRDPPHRRPLVIDALVYAFGGYEAALQAGGITAIHATAVLSKSNFAESLDSLAETVRCVQEDDRLLQVQQADDILKAKETDKVGVILGFQNAKPIEDNIERVHLYWKLGVRIVQLTYNERNYVADGCLEPNDGGLSRFGRLLVREMQQAGITVDLSHCSERTVFDTIEHTDAPVVFTHANARKLTNNPRNKSDAALQAVAETGGMIGVSCWGPICWPTARKVRPSLDDFLTHIEYVVDLVGVDHVGIGSDFSVGMSDEGIQSISTGIATRYPEVVDAYNHAVGVKHEVRYPIGLTSHADFPAIADGLLARGYDENDIHKILGENFLRVFRQTWGG